MRVPAPLAVAPLLLLTACGSEPDPRPRPVASPAPSPDRDGGRVHIDVERATVQVLASALGEAGGRTVHVDPDAADREVSIALDGPWRDALDELAAAAGLRVEELDSGPFAGDLALREVARVTVLLSRADLRTALRLMASWDDRAVIVPAAVPHDPQTLDLWDVPWADELRALVEINGLRLVERGPDLLEVVAPAGAEPVAAADYYDEVLAGAVAAVGSTSVTVAADGGGDVVSALPRRERSPFAARIHDVLAAGAAGGAAPRVALTRRRAPPHTVTNLVLEYED